MHPHNQFLLHHHFLPANAKRREIRLIQQVLYSAPGQMKQFRQLTGIQYIRQIFQRFLGHGFLLSGTQDPNIFEGKQKNSHGVHDCVRMIGWVSSNASVFCPFIIQWHENGRFFPGKQKTFYVFSDLGNYASSTRIPSSSGGGLIKRSWASATLSILFYAALGV